MEVHASGICKAVSIKKNFLDSEMKTPETFMLIVLADRLFTNHARRLPYMAVFTISTSVSVQIILYYSGLGIFILHCLGQLLS